MIDYQKVKNKTVSQLVSTALNYYRANKLDDALRAISAAMDESPDNPDALYLLGSIYQKCDKFGLSEVVFRRAVELYPNRDTMWAGLGTAIKDPARAQEAIKYFETALSLDPTNTVPMTNSACIYNEIGEFEKALEYAERSLLNHPNPSCAISAHDGIGMASLGLEDWARGWDENIYSLGQKFRKEIVYGDEERWDGSPDKTVIVYGEQGLGDEIFYGSCIPDAIERCKHVIIDCDPKLEGLFSRSFPDADVYGTRRLTADWPHKHKWDARASMGTLPQYFRRTKESFPGKPFLIADPIRRKQWRLYLNDWTERPKIGIAWTGGGKHSGRKYREIPTETFQPLSDIGDLISLEYDKSDPGDLPVTVFENATLTQNYDDVAALVAELDFVVTTCTAVVHLAGALGIPCFAMTSKYPSWRYAHNMPWYSSVKLYKYDEGFERPMARIIEELYSLLDRKVA